MAAKRSISRKATRSALTESNPAQLPLAFEGWRSFTLEDLRAEIAAKEAAAAKALEDATELKTALRNRLGGAAAKGKRRRRRIPPDEICAIFEEERNISLWGAVGRVAKRLGCSTKTVMRGLNDQEASAPELVARRYRGSRRKAVVSD